ncbi:MAG: HDOD domain-containing protein [Desulfobacteraceae bacterium]|nr:HDOD domain-containing protein [Desulfobacteraceae bacterium]
MSLPGQINKQAGTQKAPSVPNLLEKSADEFLMELNSVHELPTLPSVAMQVNRMLQDIETPAQELAKVIEKDHAIVPKLLKLVNSAFFGFSKKVTNVAHAIMLMGFNTVRNAVVTIAVIDSVKLQGKFNGFDISSFWLHAIAVATVSRYLDEQTGGRHKEDIFTAGLIHDIGKVVMANFYSEHFALVLRDMAAEKKGFREIEKRYFPLGHDSIGAYLSLRWNLPKKLRRVIAFHHDPEKKAVCDPLTLLVHSADVLISSHFDSTGPKVKQTICDSANKIMFSQIKDVRKWMPEVKKKAEEAYYAMAEGLPR